MSIVDPKDTPHTVDVYDPSGTTSDRPYLVSRSGLPCNIEPHKKNWRQQIQQMGQFAGKIYLMEWYDGTVLYDHQRIYWPAKSAVFEVEYETDDTNRDPFTTSLPAYQVCNLIETQVPHIP